MRSPPCRRAGRFRASVEQSSRVSPSGRFALIARDVATLWSPPARVVSRLADLGISRSADLSTRARSPARLTRMSHAARTVVGVRGRLAAKRPHVDPVTVDRVLAVILTSIALGGILLGNDASAHRLGAALMAPLMTVPIAFRRRWPFVVGTVVPVVGAFDHMLWDAQSGAYPLAEFLALYALAAWTSTREFVIGTVAFAT